MSLTQLLPSALNLMPVPFPALMLNASLHHHKFLILLLTLMLTLNSSLHYFTLHLGQPLTGTRAQS